ncbi:hypothetical protein [Salinisphaera orenii]|uniref:Uncharacterized protein n=1 Tax=Salinisphaera orenii YIM 95161 TaxID=1051139 RepID=A0A423PGV7_9GAMM|nr:hypothetical protein [Salinisphaera halophila]ROO24804.1 hypothetical protein SAHL_15395 [Salinisphaera halophila YIM 95161]
MIFAHFFLWRPARYDLTPQRILSRFYGGHLCHELLCLLRQLLIGGAALP